MRLREKLQNGWGRGTATLVIPISAGLAYWFFWPNDPSAQSSLLNGLQKVAFVTAAFAVTAYNLRTRVIDLILKIDSRPNRLEEFARVARGCGWRLTNLVLLFTITSLFLGGIPLLPIGTLLARAGSTVILFMFAASMVSFFYIVFAFERLERFSLDEAERASREKEAKRLLVPKA